MRRRSRQALILVLIAAPVAVWVLHAALLRSMGFFLVADEAPFKADVIEVLGGDFTCDRILKAAELARQGWAPRVIVTGGLPVYGKPEPDLAIRCAVDHGYTDVKFEPVYTNSLSTLEEAQALQGSLRQAQVKAIVVVTSSYHTRRAGLILRRQLGPGVQVRMVGVADRFWSPDAWWHNREGRKTQFYETSKTIATWLGL